jgi:hypothetical protein
MIMNGVRDPEKVADVLKIIIDNSTYLIIYFRRLYTTEVITLGDRVFQIYEQIKDGTFAQLFGNLGDLDRLCFESREQIDEFCKAHPDKLLSDFNETFFLYKKREKFWVIRVVVHGDGYPERLRVNEYPLEYDYINKAYRRERYVIPQL